MTMGAAVLQQMPRGLTVSGALQLHEDVCMFARVLRLPPCWPPFHDLPGSSQLVQLGGIFWLLSDRFFLFSTFICYWSLLRGS